MRVRCTRGFGKVEHPETGEEINVEEPFETDEETFALLQSEYPGFEVVEVYDPECGVNGCSRSVSDPDATCWQHQRE